ncbi:hypothetical protein MAE02_48380 [Microvirga aerophila]|uniref:Uncharacterized protein n=1 Tax=Microvirga aerophila TaxID=670291 RepID=A0A512BYV3_9HYPH|nr:hypothetical protein MAE02_48380 [Microvirga aerophila]
MLHPWLYECLGEILAELQALASVPDPTASAAWEVWQVGPTVRFTSLEDLPPLCLLLVWENPASHKTPELVLWPCARYHAARHAGGWQLAQHCGVHLACAQASGRH